MKSAGMPRVERSSMVESSAIVTGSRENCRVDPRREITCSMVSGGMRDSLSDSNAEVVSLAGGISLLGVLPRHATTSATESREEAS